MPKIILNGQELYGQTQNSHVVKDSAGTSVAQQPVIQFKNARVTNDSTNNKTVVEQVVSLSQAKYDALPSSKNSDGTFYDVYNAPTQAFPSMGYTPVGTVISIMGTSAPTNFLACNGQTVNIADYPVLANYFYEQFGQINKFGGDGTTTFGIPDARDLYLRGASTTNAVGTHLDATQIPIFQTDSNGTLYVMRNNGGSTVVKNSDGTVKQNTGTPYWAALTSTTGAEQTKDAAKVRPESLCMLFCIAVRDIYIGKDSALAGRVDAINERFNYSTAEKVVGKWYDGRNRYEKTVVVDADPVPSEGNTQFYTVDSDITHQLIFYTGVIEYKSNNIREVLPFVNIRANDGAVYLQGSVHYDATNGTRYRIRVGVGAGGTHYAYITYQYTKSTDTAS